MLVPYHRWALHQAHGAPGSICLEWITLMTAMLYNSGVSQSQRLPSINQLQQIPDAKLSRNLLFMLPLLHFCAPPVP